LIKNNSEMKEILYLDCATGISGDMTVAALLDLGADRDVLAKALDSIPAEGFSTRITRVKKAGLDCCDFDVVLDKELDNHDHDMAYLYGHETGENHGHDDEHHGHGGHAHRTLGEIEEILAECDITDHALELAGRIFEILAEAEAKAHGTTPEAVHFHEVGAIDSIVDIVAAAVCLDDLHIEDVVIPRLCEGTGTVRSQHGILPVPVPAVANILSQSGIPLEIMPDVRGEFVTPTGAAIASAVCTSTELPARFTIERIGLGAGKREYERPGILRAMLIRTSVEETHDFICKLESNIDDCTGEVMGYCMERLLEAGACDVHFTPVYMKKNRPAWQLNVICSEADVPDLERIIFEETTTIGIRRVRMERTILPREQAHVQTDYGPVEVKVVTVGGTRKYFPEYESVAALARGQEVAFAEIYKAAVEACGRKWGYQE